VQELGPQGVPTRGDDVVGGVVVYFFGFVMMMMGGRHNCYWQNRIVHGKGTYLGMVPTIGSYELAS
jgi:hypothetical protein